MKAGSSSANAVNANQEGRQEDPVDILQLAFFRHFTITDNNTSIEKQRLAQNIAQELINIAGASASKLFEPDADNASKTRRVQVQQHSFSLLQIQSQFPDSFENFTIHDTEAEAEAEHPTSDNTVCARYPNMYEDDSGLYVSRRGESALTCKKTSVNCVYCTDDDVDVFIKIQTEDGQDPMINEVINANSIKDCDAFLEYDSHCLIPYWNIGKHCQTLQLKPILRPKEGWITVLECRKRILNGNWTEWDNDAILTEMDRIIGIWKEKRVEHNDMHLNNIFYNTVTGKMKIIDYGRMWIPRERIPLALVDDCKQKYGMTDDSADAVLDKMYSDASLMMWQMRDPQIGHMCDMVAMIYNLLRCMQDVPWPSWFTADTDEISFKISDVYAYMLARKRGSGCNAWDAMAFFALCCHALMRYVMERKTTVAFPEEHLDVWQIITCKDFANYVLYPNRIVSPSKFAPIGAIVKQILREYDGYEIIYHVPVPPMHGSGNAIAHPFVKNMPRNFNNTKNVAKNSKTNSNKKLVRNARAVVFDDEEDEPRSIPFTENFAAYAFDPQRHYYLAAPDSAVLIRDAIVNKLKQAGSSAAMKKRSVCKEKKPKKEFKLYIDKNTQKKYIRKSNKQWFLHKHRGQYRYSSAAKTHVFLSQGQC